MNQKGNSETSVQIFLSVLLIILVGVSIFLFFNNATPQPADVNTSTTQTGTTTGDDVDVAARSCTNDGQCNSGQFCNQQNQCAAKRGAGSNCTADRQCLNGSCLTGICSLRASCSGDTDCPTSQFCATNRCRDRRTNGEACGRNRQCASNICDGDTCRTSTTGGTTNQGGTGLVGDLPATASENSITSNFSNLMLMFIAMLVLFLGVLLGKSPSNTLAAKPLKPKKSMVSRVEFESKFE